MRRNVLKEMDSERGLNSDCVYWSGQMGAPMAHNLLKAGFTVIGHDRATAVADQFAGQPEFQWA
jgi:hypothetical protein